MKVLYVLTSLSLVFGPGRLTTTRSAKIAFIPANDPHIRYMGRIDWTNPKEPRCWQPGTTVTVKYTGDSCAFLLHDQVLWGNSHNYVEVVPDDAPAYRIQTKTAHDTLWVHATRGATHTPAGPKQGRDATGAHIVTLCKDTESGIGFLGLEGLLVEGLSNLPAPPVRKIEFIGNSITCGSGIDVSEIACGAGKWYDQHNAWFSYGPITARALDAQWHITAVSGIGLMHSCCNMGRIIMPRVFDKIDQRDDSLVWDFSRYIPDVVTVCLGQNDGIQDSTAFCGNYVSFLDMIRAQYPAAKIVCLTSPMGDERLTAVLQRYLRAIVGAVNARGDKSVYGYFYSKRYFHGCGTHPDMAEHREIAAELTAFLKKLTGW